MLLPAALAAIAACTQVQDIARVNEVPLVLADTAGQARTLAYQLPEPSSDGLSPRITVLRGTACQLGSQRATRTTPFTIPDWEYANVFQDEFRRAGYRALDAVAAGTPVGAGGVAAEFRIIGVMSNVRANVCLPAADLGNVYDGKGEASLTVRWEIHGQAGRGAVYTTTQRGYARIDEPIPAVPRELMRAAFARAIHGLLADEGFRAAMRQ
jgi:hypothetical protein